MKTLLCLLVLSVSALAQSAQSAADRDEQERLAALARIRETPADKELRERLSRVPVTTIRVMASDLPNYIGKTVAIDGAIDVSDYYNYGYRGLSTLFYSYKLTDGTSSGYIYELRGAGETLRRQVVAAGGPLKGRFYVQISANIRHEEGEGVMAQLIKAVPLSK